MYDLAIIGGMGSAAAAELFRRTVLYTDAKSDREHLSVCVLNDPLIPDRSEYILSRKDLRESRDTAHPASAKKGSEGLSAPRPRNNRRFVEKKDLWHLKKRILSKDKVPPSPLKSIKRHIREAKRLHCRFFVIACNTAHFFYPEYEKARGIRFINMVKETCEYTLRAYPSRDICVLATCGTVKADIYGDLSPRGTRLLYPSYKAQNAVSGLIFKIKSGDRDIKRDAEAVEKALSEEFDLCSTVFILACTELSLAASHFNLLITVDSTDVLAAKAILLCGKALNRASLPLKAELLNGFSEK